MVGPVQLGSDWSVSERGNKTLMVATHQPVDAVVAVCAAFLGAKTPVLFKVGELVC